MARRIGLVGCVKQKRTREASARDLYTSPLFQGRRRAVEQSCDAWFILPALHGVVRPEDRLAPYDVSLTEMGRAARGAWSQGVVRALEAELGSFADVEFELHVGSAYLEHGLVDGLRARGGRVSWPTHGMPMGRQLRHYGAR